MWKSLFYVRFFRLKCRALVRVNCVNWMQCFFESGCVADFFMCFHFYAQLSFITISFLVSRENLERETI